LTPPANPGLPIHLFDPVRIFFNYFCGHFDLYRYHEARKIFRQWQNRGDPVTQSHGSSVGRIAGLPKKMTRDIDALLHSGKAPAPVATGGTGAFLFLPLKRFFPSTGTYPKGSYAIRFE
jgi:hypothetical protein